MPRRGRSPDRLIFYIALLIALGLFLASATGLISFATLTPKPGWKPPKCRNPDDFISSSHGGSFSFGIPSKYVEVKVVSQKLKWIKASVTPDRNVIWHVSYYAKIKYRAKPFYAILNSNPDRACFYVEWAGDNPSEAPYKYPEPVKLIPEIIVSEKPRTGYYYLQTIGKVLKGEGTHVIDVSYKPLGMWAGPDITIRFKKDDGSYVKVPPCAGWSFHPRIELKDLDKFVKGEVTVSHKLETFKRVFGEDPRKTPVDVCDLFVRYPAGDWPKPAEFSVQPVGEWDLNRANQLRIVFRPRGGVWDRGFKLKMFYSGVEWQKGYRLVDTIVSMNGGTEITKTLDARFFKHPGYYTLRIEADWGGYILSDEKTIKIGEPAIHATATPATGEPQSKPIAAVGGDFPIKKTGEVYQLGVKATDPAKVEIDWGDGSKTETTVKDEQAFSKAYPKPGNYTIDVKIYDQQGNPVKQQSLPLVVEPSKPLWQQLAETLQAFLDWLLSLLGVK